MMWGHSHVEIAVDEDEVLCKVDLPALTIVMIVFSCYYLAFLRRWNCVMDAEIITGGCSSFGGLRWGCPPRLCHHFTFYTLPGIQPTATKQPDPATFIIEGSGWVRHSIK